MKRYILLPEAIFLLGAAVSAGACPATLDHPLALRNAVPYLVESEHGHMAAGEDRLGFVQPDFGALGCGELPDPKIRLADSASQVGFLLVGGAEYRYQKGSATAIEAGSVISGRKSLVSFRLDARTFTDVGENPGRAPLDLESYDEQSRSTSGSLDYRSYSRFRGDITAQLPFGKLTVAHEAAHWGPGLFGNLMLNQAAIPFFQYAFTTRLGPLNVTSLYGDLSAGPLQASSPENTKSRSMYAHRYELSLGDNWLLAVNEQLILYELSKPYLFAPIIPLFIAKGFLYEDYTNGNLGADLTWRSPWSTLFYAEFLLDDLESPSSLLTRDYIQNKWGALGGVHWEAARAGGRAGFILEATTIEPWVYAHFVPRTAQAANSGQPLGNPQGADSRSFMAKGYWRKSGFYTGLKAGLYWKGKGMSADLDSPVPKDETQRKIRLEGAGTPDLIVEPDLAYRWRRLDTYLTGRLGPDALVRIGTRFFY